jgi:hypothetical protein
MPLRIYPLTFPYFVSARAMLSSMNRTYPSSAAFAAPIEVGSDEEVPVPIVRPEAPAPIIRMKSRLSDLMTLCPPCRVES